MAFFRLLFLFVFLDKHASIVVKKGNEHTCFWRKEIDGGVNLPCCLCVLASPFGFSKCRSFALLFLYHRAAFLCVSLSWISHCILSFLSSSLPYTLPLSVFLSPSFGSVLPLAFIARGRRRFLVTAGVHNGGEEHQPRDAPPLDCSYAVSAANASPVFIASRRQWIVFSETAPFCHFKWYFRFGPWMFMQFCNHAPGKIVIRSLDFSACSGLVLGFGLFPWSP